MFRRSSMQADLGLYLDTVDRVAVGYIVLPLAVFVASWFVIWVAIPMLACIVFSVRSIAQPRGIRGGRLPVSRLQFAVALMVGCAWAVFGGTAHILFANPDWHVRDAVLHDLVMSPWPIGYGLLGGHETLLRAPVAYYLPAALVGKLAGLTAAHWALALWTALGAVLFLLQVLSLTPSRLMAACGVVAIAVFFSGFDVIGNILSNPRFLVTWNVARHIEWWAGTYQYSAMTTQLFWVPNHALAAWLVVGLISRDGTATRLDEILPILIVSAALWSPLSALGLMPFVLFKVMNSIWRDKSIQLLQLNIWLPACLVGYVVSLYLTMDPSGIAKGFSIAGNDWQDTASELLRLTQFWLLEAGFLGFAILALRRSSEVILALSLLWLLPLAQLGPFNDLVMRGSIPCLVVLAIASCVAMTDDSPGVHAVRNKVILGCLLAIGAVTPMHEFARAIVLRRWPINTDADLVGANCGVFPPHYIAKLAGQTVQLLLREPHRVPAAQLRKQACDNPAIDLMWHGRLL